MLDNHQGLEVIDMGYNIVLWNTGEWILYTPEHHSQSAGYHVTKSGGNPGYLEGLSVVADFKKGISRRVCLLQNGSTKQTSTILLLPCSHKP